MRDTTHYIGTKYRLVRTRYEKAAYTDAFGKKHAGHIVLDHREVTVKAVGFWNNGYEEDTPLLIAEPEGDNSMVFNGYVNTIDYWGGIRWSEKVFRDSSWRTFNPRDILANEDGTPWVWPVKRTLRDNIRDAIDAALAAGDLSEDWAATLYANLDEPEKHDEEGWEILNRTKEN